LKGIAEVRFGIKTGANEFFYLPKPGESNKFFRAEIEYWVPDKKIRKEVEKEVIKRLNTNSGT